MTDADITDAIVDRVVAEVVQKGRQKAAEPAPETPAPSRFANLSENDVVKLVRAVGNTPDGELAWLARRIEAAREREKHRKVRPPERHGGRPFREDEEYD